MVHRSRRLHDTILVAVHRACNGGQLEVAARLLRLSEEVMSAETDPKRRRHEMWTLIAAHERLWYLRHPDAELPPDEALIEESSAASS